jgi:hypothetical protein
MIVRSAKVVSLGLVVLATAGLLSGVAAADGPTSTQSSANYQLVESSLGDSSLLHSSSDSYSLSEAIGTTAIGNSGSDNYQVNAGAPTTADPSLSVIIDNSTPAFGSFSPASTATATSTFQVLNYTSYGYNVILMGNPPRYNGHTITPMGTTAPEASQPGIEQFGVNLVQNDDPNDPSNPAKHLGANPDYGQFGTALAKPTANYNTPDKFRYVSGESIATSPKSSGLVKYTLSYIVNVAPLTPGGQYKSNQSIVVIATY